MSRHEQRIAKPLGIIMPSVGEKAAFDSLSERQKAYFLHWVSSNRRQWNWFWTGIRKTREQRP